MNCSSWMSGSISVCAELYAIAPSRLCCWNEHDTAVQTAGTLVETLANDELIDCLMLRVLRIESLSFLPSSGTEVKHNRRFLTM